MIPDFKTYIKESIWSDMQDRSSGESVRKEDDIDNLDGIGFSEYLKDHYKKLGVFAITISDTFFQTQIFIPLFADNRGTFYDLVIDVYKDKPYCYLHMSKLFQQRCGDLYKKLKDNNFFSMDMVEYDQGWYVEILPNDRSKATNTFAVKVIDFILSIIEEPYKKLIEKVD